MKPVINTQGGNIVNQAHEMFGMTPFDQQQ
jgi:hypothetical protein